jgi:cytochrome P450
MVTLEDWARPSAVKQLQFIESALRESLRVNPLVIRGPAREVIPEHGIVLPDGQHAPRGSWLAISVPNVHNDERFYQEAAEYRPFRFVIPDKQEGKPDIPLFKVEDSFLGFGHGRTAW